MSFIEVMLSRREVVLSLALVALVLFFAALLAILPVLRKRWKRIQAQRKARQAAKIAQLKKKKAAAKIAYQKKQAEEAAAQAEAEEDGLGLVIDPVEAAPLGASAATSATAPVVTVQAAPTPASAPAATATASPITPSTTAEGTAVTPAGTPAPFHAEEKPAEEEEEQEDDGDLAGLLDVFVDEEANARYEVLMRDVEVMSAEELVEMATKLKDDLRARRNAPGSDSSAGAA
jgi:hypothetical protein